ncbi:hypothetical protein [Frigidibacter mobilis]|nr:hypothetical protein [Frigidibacter mobilis]
MTDKPQNFPTNSDGWSPERGEGGRFLPGQGGRPKGSKNRFAATTMQEIKNLKDAAMTALAAQVVAGNMDAVKFILERIVGRHRMIELDGGTPADVTNALVNGEISSEEAKAIATVVEKLRRVEDLDVLAARLEELERLLKGDSL